MRSRRTSIGENSDLVQGALPVRAGVDGLRALGDDHALLSKRGVPIKLAPRGENLMERIALIENLALRPLSRYVLSRQRASAAISGVVVGGICQLLGLAPFTPHDLRRTAATLCGELNLSEAAIALCLDHQANKDDDGKPLPAITRKVYIHATRIQVAKKRKVLDAWAVELRRIIGEPVAIERIAA